MNKRSEASFTLYTCRWWRGQTRYETTRRPFLLWCAVAAFLRQLIYSLITQREKWWLVLFVVVTERDTWLSGGINIVAANITHPPQTPLWSCASLASSSFTDNRSLSLLCATPETFGNNQFPAGMPRRPPLLPPSSSPPPPPLSPLGPFALPCFKKSLLSATGRALCLDTPQEQSRVLRGMTKRWT